ncbi:MAG: GNAT family N-acetyltransferase [Alphaproteobacteria bacterium]
MSAGNLAELVETLERDAFVDMYRAAPVGLAAATGLEVAERGGTALLSLAAVPDPLFNRAFGLGIAAPATEDDLDAILAHYARVGAARWWLQPSPAARPDRLAAWLAARGLAPVQRIWAKFAHGGGPQPAAETDLRVEEVGPDRAGDFAGAAQRGFGAPPPFQAWLAALVGRPGWHCYCAYDGAQPVAAGALLLSADGAWLGIGATVPEARRRGAQSALLARRVADARAHGAQAIVTETGQPLPGEPGPSYANIGRAGFRIVHLRPNLALAGYA